MTLYLLPMLLAENSHNRALTPYAVEQLKTIKVLFVENIRTTRRFLSSLKQGIVIDEIRFYEVTKDTPFERIYSWLSALNVDAGILSEAGCAGVADPGGLLVEAAHQLGIRVQPLVGPNSILLALMGSGMNGQSFAFHGYLPIAEGERAARIRELEKLAVKQGQTQIFMETPYRNNSLLHTLLQVLQPATRLCVAVDLTGESEYLLTKSIGAWRSQALPDVHKRPALFLINV